MKKIWIEAKALFQQKAYIVCMVLTLLATYGSLLVKPALGIDDTAWKVYFVDGVAPVMGRWVLYVMNKIIPIAEYNPFVVEGLFLFFFLASATIWVVLFKRIIGSHVSDWAYILFGCAFLAAPITSEVVTYYLANGIFLGFGFTALAVWYLWDSFKEGISLKKRAVKILESSLWLWLALGCYESFIIVYMVAICVLYAFERGLKGAVGTVPKVLLNTLFAGVFCILLRSVWTKVSIVVFSLQSQTNVLHYRGISELLTWFEDGKGLQDILWVLKQFFVKYYINAVVYKPITFLLLGFGLLGIWALIKAVQKRDGVIFLAVIGAALAPWILPLLEGYATYYRTSQYIVLMNAVIVLAAALLFEKVRERQWCRVLGLSLAAILVYHEVYEMNYWLKTDWDKYQDACRTADAVALEIIRDYDESLPICVVGKYEVPDAIACKSYSPVWSKKTMLAKWAIELIDDDLLAEYMEPQGYRFAETPLLSVIKWGSTAFYAHDIELIKFWENRGFTLVADRDLSHYEYGNRLVEEGMPSWPEEGSIVQMEGYILINLDNAGR